MQVRGSIPLFWEQKQKGLKNTISIKRSLELTSHVFDGHLENLIADYNKVIMVNLVKKTKKDECQLTEALISLL